MVSIDTWMTDLILKLKVQFEDRLVFAGIQGGYRRNEANDNCDIDTVIILDRVFLEDLRVYRKILATMPDSKRACGFISGVWELSNWPKHELFQLKNDTLELHGSLEGILPPIERTDIIDSVRIEASGLYHACCHTYVHGTPENYIDTLYNSYKKAFFLLQAIHFLRSGIYISNKNELLPQLAQTEQEILSTCLNWDTRVELIKGDMDSYFDVLIKWCSDLLGSVDSK